MSTITLKKVPDRLHNRLKARARRSGRSLNREIIETLEEAVHDERPDVDQILGEIRAFRERVKVRLTPAEIQRFKVWGRR